MKKNYFIISFIFFAGITKINAQFDSSILRALDTINLNDIFGEPPSKKSYFKVSLSYLTNYVYGGRKEAINYPYLTPGIEYNHKSGFYASFSGSYLTNQYTRWDVRNIEVGFTVDSIKKFSGNAYVCRSFYNANSSNVQSDISWIVGASVIYDAKYINIGFAPSLFIGSNVDFAFNLQADHSFEFKNNAHTYSFTICPTITSVFANTGYVEQNNIARVRREHRPDVTYTQTISSPNHLQLLSFDFAIPLYYDRKKWGCYLTPTYALALNPTTASIAYTRADGRRLTTIDLQTFNSNPKIYPKSYTEQLSNSFFAEVGVYYKF